MAITTTALDIISRSMRLIGVLGEDEEPSGAMSDDALDALNQLIDAYQLQSLLALVQERYVFDLVADQNSYTIGPSALTPDFSTGTQPRPSSLAAAGLLLNDADPAVEVPLSLMTEQSYQQLGIKDYENPQPISVFYEPTMPTGTVIVWPTPTTSTNDLVLYVPLVTAQFADLSTSYTLAPGYARMFAYNLAVELATEYGKEVPPRVAVTAADSLRDVKIANYAMTDLGVDPGLWPKNHPVYNIWSDQG
jgi:hypothetical protein